MGALVAIGVVIVAALPALLMRLSGLTPRIEIATLLFGVAIVGAAFAISWAAEAAEHDIPRALSLTVVALLAVLPEYAVDAVFAFKAGQDPAFAPYAVANMTGSNRLLLGLGWPVIAILAWLYGGRRVLPLDRGSGLPLVFLAAATLYSFSLPFRGGISLFDSVLLIALFLAYAALAARQQTVAPQLVGPAAAIGALSTPKRRLSVLALFAFAGITIGVSAEPFAEGLVHTGQLLGIDEFLLVQWLAPLASEAPEFLVAALLAVRGKPSAGLTLLLSAKVNQWTLLIASLPLAFSIGAGQPGTLPLDARQSAEVLLTAAQSLFGVAVLASLSLTLLEAGLLAGLFVAQLVVGGFLRARLHDPAAAAAELFWFSVLYVLLSVVFLFQARSKIGRILRRDLPAAVASPSGTVGPTESRAQVELRR
ncbi:MAG: sodium:calcium antiporter [Chloroflexota bacterium]|nr:sodium:calcium antiporter [Chloroflexota bacterium]